MLNSSTIMDINLIYVKAINALKSNKSGKFKIGKLSKSVELVYVVNFNSIELGLNSKTQCKILAPTDLQLLRTQFCNDKHVIQMIDIADDLNKYSVYKPKNVENCI